jgi:hypothetical protein
LVELIMTTGTEVGALSGEEVQVAKANVVFALKNCPVDGGILTQDGFGWHVLSTDVTHRLLRVGEGEGCLLFLSEVAVKELNESDDTASSVFRGLGAQFWELMFQKVCDGPVLSSDLD